MSHAFRNLLKKIGSGVHTGENLSREESRTAMTLMLNQEATPAQIGAFLISHRIKRPTPEELAGILDAYYQLGPVLQPVNSPYPVMVFGHPYDGRSRTAPVVPIVALVLAAAGVSVLLHGGDCMPTKYGVPLVELWQGLGVDFTTLSLAQVQPLLEATGLGFLYLPAHFPQAHQLTPYRDQIGKRPPLATAELVWSPYAGETHLVAGYVHPPTESRFRETFPLMGITRYTLVKGLEGSCDLPRERTAIIAVSEPQAEEGYERLLLHPRDYGFDGKEVPCGSTPSLVELLQQVLQGHKSKLTPAAIWNSGFYLWRSGACVDLESGLEQAKTLIMTGQAGQKLQEVQAYLSTHAQSVSVLA